MENSLEMKKSKAYILVIAIFLCFIVVLVGLFGVLLTYLIEDGNAVFTIVPQLI